MSITQIRSGRIVVFGKTFKSIEEIISHYSLNESNFRQLLFEGVEVEFAITECQLTDITYKGKWYATIKDVCSDYGVVVSRVRKRLVTGWTLEDALTRSYRVVRTSKEVVYRGETFSSHNELCLYYRIDHELPLSFIKRYDCDFLTAFDFINSFLEGYQGERPSIISKIPYAIYNGVWFRDREELCVYFNTTQKILYAHVKRVKVNNPFEALRHMKNPIFLSDKQASYDTPLHTYKRLVRERFVRRDENRVTVCR